MLAQSHAYSLFWFQVRFVFCIDGRSLVINFSTYCAAYCWLYWRRTAQTSQNNTDFALYNITLLRLNRQILPNRTLSTCIVQLFHCQYILGKGQLKSPYVGLVENRKLRASCPLQRCPNTIIKSIFGLDAFCFVDLFYCIVLHLLVHFYLFFPSLCQFILLPYPLQIPLAYSSHESFICYACWLMDGFDLHIIRRDHQCRQKITPMHKSIQLGVSCCYSSISLWHIVNPKYALSTVEKYPICKTASSIILRDLTIINFQRQSEYVQHKMHSDILQLHHQKLFQDHILLQLWTQSRGSLWLWLKHMQPITMHWSDLPCILAKRPFVPINFHNWLK